MFTADPKWLEIFKLSLWQTFGGAVICAGYFLLPVDTMAPPLANDFVASGFFLFLLIFGGLTLVGLMQWTFETFDPVGSIRQRLTKRREVRELRKFIPYMTDKDRQIIGYLLYRKQRIFNYLEDGGYASDLIARGIVVFAVRQPQAVSEWRFPFEIPDHLWTELEQGKYEFEYRPDSDGVHPWAIPMMAR